MGGTKQKNRQHFQKARRVAIPKGSRKNLRRRRRGPAKERIPLGCGTHSKVGSSFHRKRSVKDVSYAALRSTRTYLLWRDAFRCSSFSVVEDESVLQAPVELDLHWLISDYFADKLFRTFDLKATLIIRIFDLKRRKVFDLSLCVEQNPAIEFGRTGISCPHDGRQCACKGGNPKLPAGDIRGAGHPERLTPVAAFSRTPLSHEAGRVVSQKCVAIFGV
ncbi:hypothetical protein CDAR_395211 [Caerostris darwini]|uniref:Uncharacterized protein n=1 Tax=Caerostris darwini TaxID=1538125 RepID=A0AAV4Q9D0_9ARAC|nr:hypothetical protein CDAR_395211 [Caerostris darwini]